MSLFDVIKYPISDIPTHEELVALPEKLYDDWINNHTVDWFKEPTNVRYDRYNVAEWFRLVLTLSKNRNPHMIKAGLDLAALRKLIQEYEE